MDISFSSPDTEYWKKRESAMLAEFTCLLEGYDPQAFQNGTNYYNHHLSEDGEGKKLLLSIVLEFNKNLKLLEEALHSEAVMLFKKGDSNNSDSYTMKSLVQWALSKGLVDELMALCDTLKIRIQESQTTQVNLADAAVEQAVD